ncbi:hypothetical protein RCO27_17740 [Sphingosinicella sp. LHD-64]|nr:hypothetical protein [Sphingosinicella sp. LHD-64]MDQ8758073.1 hypothetical protein [Sphingosinicella sp. LHD-64]
MISFVVPEDWNLLALLAAKGKETPAFAGVTWKRIDSEGSEWIIFT